jgi:PAS domain S-box-containing protein
MKSPKMKKPAAKNADIPNSMRSLREDAEQQLVRSEKPAPKPVHQTAEELIHELQVHQIELEMQAEELRRAHLALEESRDKYLDLYEFAPLGYLTLDDKALVTDANLTGAMLLGVERKKLVRARFSRFVAETDADTWHRFFTKVMTGREKVCCTLLMQREDGVQFPARIEGIRISGLRDGSATVRVAVSDITDIRKIEDALRLSHKKLSLLASITRHDLSNNLVTVSGYLELLQRKVTDSALLQDFARVTDACDRMTGIIRFARDYEQVGVGEPRWQDCRSLIENAEMQTVPGRVGVINDMHPGLELFADPLILKVFSNLIDNAVRHGGKITRIRFSLQEAGDDRILLCEDDGDGIAPRDKELIFQRGFGKNTGLGLTLSREILAITKMTIRETGEQGKGARFEITVPKGVFRIAEQPPEKRVAEKVRQTVAGRLLPP